MRNKLTFVRKINVLLLSSVLFSGTCFAEENAKVKELVSSKYYDTLVKKGVVSQYRDNGSKGFNLLPKTIYAAKINESQIVKDEKNYPYTFEGLYLLNKKDLLSKGKSGKKAITIDDVSVVVRSVSFL